MFMPVQHTPRQVLRRDPVLQLRERDQVVMFRLSDQEWQVPRLDRCEVMLWLWIRQFEREGGQAVRHKPLGTGPIMCVT